MSEETKFSRQRRSFLGFLNSRVAVLGAMAAGTTAMAQEKPATPWQPARHAKDDWMDEVPGKHRLVFDTTTSDGFGEALAFAGNFLRANKTDYGLQDNDLAVLIVARHRSTAFAYNDAIWAKYGKHIAGQTKFEDPKTKEPPVINVYNATDFGVLLPNKGTSVDSLTKRGVQLVVCSMATRALAGVIASKTGGKTDAIFKEITANLMGNAHLAAAGIVGVSRAQERGYSLVTT